MNIKIEFINFKIEHQPKIELALKECVPHNTNLNYINIIYLDVDSLNNRLLLRKIKNKNSNDKKHQHGKPDKRSFIVWSLDCEYEYARANSKC